MGDGNKTLQGREKKNPYRSCGMSIHPDQGEDGEGQTAKKKKKKKIEKLILKQAGCFAQRRDSTVSFATCEQYQVIPSRT